MLVFIRAVVNLITPAADQYLYFALMKTQKLTQAMAINKIRTTCSVLANIVKICISMYLDNGLTMEY